jgi:hypothetical protein
VFLAHTNQFKGKKMNLKVEDLDLLHKYLYNKVDFDEFKKLLEIEIPFVDDNYAKEKWEIFNKNQISFICSIMGSQKMLDKVIEDIKNKNYEG